MERSIDNRLITCLYLAGMLWMAIAVVYGLYGGDTTNDAMYRLWWAIDKLNDRIFEINLLLIASFCFTNIFIKTFSFATIFYVALRFLLEVNYIVNEQNDSDALWFISALYAGIVLLSTSIIIYVSKAKHRR